MRSAGLPLRRDSSLASCAMQCSQLRSLDGFLRCHTGIVCSPKQALSFFDVEHAHSSSTRRGACVLRRGMFPATWPLPAASMRSCYSMLDLLE